MLMHRLQTTPLYLLAAAIGSWLMLWSSPLTACTLREGDAEPTVVLPLRHEARHDHTDYYEGLLTLALQKTADDYGPCTVKIYDQIKPQARRYQSLAEGKGIDIIDATSSPERRERFREIPVPLLKGLMGYRILLIRAEDQKRFSAVRTLEDLQQYSAGQGSLWPDVAKLKHNGINVVTAHDYPSLFRMLRAKRFDFFPRGSQEILDEVRNFDTEDLVIEESLIVAYPSPVYFHVHKDNVALAERVGTGLRRAVEDGSFDNFFYKHELITGIFEELGFSERRIIFMCSPHHRNPRFLNDARFWVRPWPDDLCGKPLSSAPTLKQKKQVN